MDKVLKRRLIGASILIALAVIFLPMLLVDPDAVNGRSVSEIEIPPMPETAREVRRIPLDPDADRRPRPPPDPVESDREPVVREPEVRVQPEIILRPQAGEDDRPPPASRASEPVEEAAPAAPEVESVPAAEPGEATDRTGGAGDWIVQVASFGSAASADQVQRQLQALGHPVLRDEVVRGDSTLHRLRTGPYISESRAATAMQQIRTTVSGVEPIVQQLSGHEKAGDPPGFAVQVGVFVREDNAVGLTDRLEALGFSAFRFSEQAGERLIWRVLVGPVPERSAAEALQNRLADEADIEGLVVSHP